ncbi:MAG: glutamine-hydrolyzing carbamoyl-phosphate synthase small subunit [Phycisphaerales bacterium]|nr:glutamine-hydrolyzing carbamoyl-phosphate synthase small subunit [Phycisphaerales bacterium]
MADHTDSARLALADGSLFEGVAFGARGVTTVAEVVFNTAMTGYQESLTDPSYRGQILVQTAPLIGNTGVNGEDVESDRIQASGFVVRELARRHSNFRASDTLDGALRDAGIPAIWGIDTRALTRKIRERGAMGGALTTDAGVPDAVLLEQASAARSMAGANLVPEVSCVGSSSWTESRGDWGTSPLSGGPRVLAIDCGAKRNILRHLVERGCDVTRISWDTPAARILEMVRAGEADGLFVSNGPGDPAAVESLISTLREVLSEAKDLPVFGICLGHQLLALALGARTFKLKFGHRGANQPVRGAQGRVEITSQNHGFAVDPDSLASIGAVQTHTHLNDGTCAGFRCADRPVFAVQYHPEASPGPHDASYLFDEFVSSMR